MVHDLIRTLLTTNSFSSCDQVPEAMTCWGAELCYTRRANILGMDEAICEGPFCRRCRRDIGSFPHHSLIVVPFCFTLI